MAEGKYKYLLKNVGILSISNFGSKILSFILIPLYTGVLTTAEYGIYDVYTTTTSLFVLVFSVNILDAVYRFLIDRENDPGQVLSIGIRFCMRAAAIFCILVAVNDYFEIIKVFAEFPVYLCAYMLLSLAYRIVSSFTSGLERITDIAIAGIINAATMLLANIYFLVVVKLGLRGYFIANCLAYFIPFVYLAIRTHIWKYIFISKRTCELEKEMVSYSKPLIFSHIAWMITKTSDKYIVTWLYGVAANGIYSISYKLPSLLNIVQSIFMQAWTLSAVKEFDNKNVKFYENIYKAYNFIIVISCSALIMINKFLAKILFSNEFYEAWKYAPFLMISVVFGALSGLFDGIFTAAKKSNIIAETACAGAIVNTILNIILVYQMGPMGAAVATLVSYVVVWGLRYYRAKKIINLDIALKRDIIAYLLLMAQAVLHILIQEKWIYAAEIIIGIVVLSLYFAELCAMGKKLSVKLRRK